MLNVTPLAGSRSQGRYNWHLLEAGEKVFLEGIDPEVFLRSLRARSDGGRRFWARYQIHDNGVEVVCYPVPQEALDLGDTIYDQRAYVDDVCPELPNRVPALQSQFKTKKGGRPRKYPWDEWENGEVHTASAKEYGLDTYMLAVRLRSRVARLNNDIEQEDDRWWVQIEQMDDDDTIRFVYMRRSEIDTHPARDDFEVWTRPRADDALPEKSLDRTDPWVDTGGDPITRGSDLDPIIDAAVSWQDGADIVVEKVSAPGLARALKDYGSGCWRFERWTRHGRCIRIKDYYT